MSKLSRRKILIRHMEALEDQGMCCAGCPGTCCTFEANSMLLTPLEAEEIFNYLSTSGRVSGEFRQRLEHTVKNYRLEPKYPNQGKSFLRKTYTCPFFGHQELGCSLPREVKPYGCLAFNSHHPELKAGEHCWSEKELLEQRDKSHEEESDLNQEIKRKYNILWEKAPIPNALLTFLNQLQ